MSGVSIDVFADRMLGIMPVIMREFLRRQVDEILKGKITFPQFLVMEYLERQGGAKMKDLAVFMNVTTATTTGIVDRLVRQGYVHRLLDENDRRIVKVALTTKGRQLSGKIQQLRREVIIEIFQNISPRNRREYLRILTQIRNALQGGKKEEGGNA